MTETSTAHDGQAGRTSRLRTASPNVVIIVLDDLGFADFGCYGSAIDTPCIDRLAEGGLRYNNFHVTAICAPTRACLLTGRNHHAVGMGHFPNHPRTFPAYTGRISKSAATLARLLCDAGYSTFALGKWHLTPWSEDGPAGPFDRWPLGMGFERYYGFLGGATNHWTPDLVRDNGFVEQPAAPENGYFLTEDLASEAIRFVQDQQQAAPDKPFFLYFATGATHSPHQAPPEWIERYEGNFDDGYEAARDRAFRRQHARDVIPPATTLTGRPPWVTPWHRLSSNERRLLARQMEVYAGFLTHTDAQVGRLIDFLERIEVLEDTVVMVLSDNGASPASPQHGWSNMVGMDNDVATMLDQIDELGGFHGYNHYARGWAWAGNTPFKLWKFYSWLGGVRVPLIIRWPTGISTEQHGRVRSQFCHAIDVMPTILEAAGVDVPDVVDGATQLRLDGASILATFTDADALSPRDTQYFESWGSRAIYHDGWKANTDHIKGDDGVEGSENFDADTWSLYHVADDFSEAHDLATAQPRRLRQMIELWWHEAGRNQVLPLMNAEDRQAFTAQLLSRPARLHYAYRPNGSPVSVPWVVGGFLGGFRLAADIEVSTDRDVAGIICAQGDWNCGWACYVLDGRVVLTINLGGQFEQVTSADVLVAGKHELVITYQPSSDSEGSISLTIDGGEEANVPLSGKHKLFRDKLLVGRDVGFPVCDDYRPPFAFTGHIHRVDLELLPGSQQLDPCEELATALQHD